MAPSDHPVDGRILMARTAAAIFAGAAFVGLVEGLLPGGPGFSPVPSVAAFVLAALVLVVGPHVPRAVLATLGPLGAALVGQALVSTTGATDAAVLYLWPALWTACFFGTRGAVLIVVWIAIVHAVALTAMPPDLANVDRWIDVTVSLIVVVGVVRLLNARSERLRARLEDEARTDALTGLLNRRGLLERLATEAPRAMRHGRTLSVVGLDLDHFKRINDEFGHALGDRVLVWVSHVLARETRGVDAVARVGGEEFTILLPEVEADDAHVVADRIRRAVAERTAERDRFDIPRSLILSISGGVAAGAGSTSVEQLLAAADDALYRAKRGGRDRIVLSAAAEAHV